MLSSVRGHNAPPRARPVVRCVKRFVLGVRRSQMRGQAQIPQAPPRARCRSCSVD